MKEFWSWSTFLCVFRLSGMLINSKISIKREASILPKIYGVELT
jgi:hypothetical protein